MIITKKQLETQVETINRLTGAPEKSWIGHGPFRRAQVGYYELYFANGGVNLHRIDNESGGVSEPLCGGTLTKRELYNRMLGFILGLEASAKCSH